MGGLGKTRMTPNPWRTTPNSWERFPFAWVSLETFPVEEAG